MWILKYPPMPARFDTRLLRRWTVAWVLDDRANQSLVRGHPKFRFTSGRFGGAILGDFSNRIGNDPSCLGDQYGGPNISDDRQLSSADLGRNFWRHLLKRNRSRKFLNRRSVYLCRFGLGSNSTITPTMI